MTDNIVSGIFQQLLKKPKITLGVFILLTQLFLFINADYVYGPYAPAARTTLQIYFVLLGITMAAFAAGLPKIPIESIVNFFLMFLLTSGAVLLLQPFLGGTLSSFENIRLALGFGFLHAFVKAFNEEVVFRFILPITAGLGDVISNIAFGFFHLAVIVANLTAQGLAVSYASVLLPVGLLMLLGYLWAKMRDRFGLMGATGSHWAWNLGALGILKGALGIQ